MKPLVNLDKMCMTSLFIMAGVFFMLVYLIGSNAWAENGSATKGVVIKTDDKQVVGNTSTDIPEIATSGADFIKVTSKCAKCHTKQFSSITSLKELKWIVPGKPEISPIYKIIGKTKKKDGTYHNLSDTEKSTVYNYIKDLK